MAAVKGGRPPPPDPRSHQFRPSGPRVPAPQGRDSELVKDENQPEVAPLTNPQDLDPARVGPHLILEELRPIELARPGLRPAAEAAGVVPASLLDLQPKLRLDVL